MKLLLVCFLLIPTVSLNAALNSKVSSQVESKRLEDLKLKIKPMKKSKKIVLKSSGNDLEDMYMVSSKSKTYLSKLKSESLKRAQDAVPTLVKVMKSKSFPDENRWIATFMLGRIMGVKSADFISKFSNHPNWMMRLASLKVLLHLEQKQFKGIFARALEDKSLIVRHQALQNIKELQLKELAPYVWKMLYNRDNYVGGKGVRKRSHIIADAIKTVGDLGLEKAKSPMLKMISSKKYVDIHSELDYSLSKLYLKKSPKGSPEVKKNFWSKVAISELTI